MAESKTGKNRKISRRNMVALLGSGVVVGVALDGEDAAAGLPCDQPCDVFEYTTGTGSKTRTALVSGSCCKHTRTLIMKGPGGLNQQGTAHLKPLRNTLNRVTLEEYCYMTWGLDEGQVRQLQEYTQKQFGLNPVKGSSEK
jgi:hypothetical protein